MAETKSLYEISSIYFTQFHIHWIKLYENKPQWKISLSPLEDSHVNCRVYSSQRIYITNSWKRDNTAWAGKEEYKVKPGKALFIIA